MQSIVSGDLERLAKTLRRLRGPFVFAELRRNEGPHYLRNISGGHPLGSPGSTPRARLSMPSVKDDQDDERQKGRELHAKQ
jgi:hypothetical protein